MFGRKGRRRKTSLQWRAGQLPGLTLAAGSETQATPTPSMEGRAAARPYPDGAPADDTAVDPSMEGRAAARPDRSVDLVRLKCLFADLCERFWETRVSEGSRSIVKVRFTLCHKAASGPWDLRSQPSARIR